MKLDEQRDYNENSERATSIYYKTITYMYRFYSNKGFLIFPSNNTVNVKYKIKDTNGILLKIGVKIPQQVESLKKFKDEIITAEKYIIDTLEKYDKSITPADSVVKNKLNDILI